MFLTTNVTFQALLNNAALNIGLVTKVIDFKVLLQQLDIKNSAATTVVKNVKIYQSLSFESINVS